MSNFNVTIRFCCFYVRNKTFTVKCMSNLIWIETSDSGQREHLFRLERDELIWKTNLKTVHRNLIRRYMYRLWLTTIKTKNKMKSMTPKDRPKLLNHTWCYLKEQWVSTFGKLFMIILRNHRYHQNHRQRADPKTILSYENQCMETFQGCRTPDLALSSCFQFRRCHHWVSRILVSHPST